MGGKFDFSGHSGEESVIRAFLDVFARVNPGAALFDDNHAGFDNFAVMNFYAEAFGH